MKKNKPNIEAEKIIDGAAQFFAELFVRQVDEWKLIEKKNKSLKDDSGV